MFKKLFGPVLIGFLFFSCFGLKGQQSGTPYQNLISVNTKSPEAASLGKFGNIPVSYVTGVPGISIPIFDISVGGLSIPISLDYHAGGIRVDETSSCVGTGWALNGTGTVSRNMVGLPDESTGFLEPSAQTVFSNPSQNWQYIYSIRNNSSDAGPDIFQYSAGGISGKFIFKKDGSIIQIPVTNNKISYNPGNSFTIIDQNGITYFFNETRNNSSSDANAQPYVSTWCLTYIVAANSADTVNYIYENNLYSSYEKITNFTQDFGETLGTQPFGNFGEAVTVTSDIGSHQTFVTLTHQEFYLKEINWKNGKLVFNNIADRQDVTGSGLRLNGVDVYSKNGGQQSLIKRVKLFQSYFLSNPYGVTVNEKNYRLKLDSVGYQDVFTNATEQMYNVTYNTTPIAPRESYAQDRWGFSNGHYENSNLMPIQTALFNGQIYTFGGANRDTDSLSHLAGTITSIKYPTKGKTVFELEPHRYHTNLFKTEAKSIFQQACCGTSPYTSTQFTVNSISSNFSYTAFISKFDYPDVTDRPFIKITDLTTGVQYVKIVTIPTTATNIDYSTGTQPMSGLQVGHTYFIEINIFTTNLNVKASINIDWIETNPNVPEVKSGGGLRIKSLTNYDENGRFTGKELYSYGTDSTGKILTPQYYQDINYETVVHRVGGKFNGSGCSYMAEYDINLLGANYAPPGYTTIYHANSILPTSQYSGSPVLYPMVTKIQVDSSGKPNGKSVYSFNVTEDGSSSPFQPITGILTQYNPTGGVGLISNTWKNGSLVGEDVYKSSGGSYQLVSQKTNHIAINLFSYENFLTVKPNFIQTGCEFQGPSTIATDFTLSLAPITTGVMLPDTLTETMIDNNGNAFTTAKTLTYGVTPLLPVKTETISSKGNVLTENIKYPKDVSVSGNIYEKMVNRNILAAVVQSQQLKDNSQTSLLKINYFDWFGNSKLIMPQYVERQNLNAAIETRLNFNTYDKSGNIQEQQKANDVKEVYLWGYNSQYPVAKILNSTYAVANTKITQSILDNPSDDATLKAHLNNLRTIPGALVTTYTYAPLIGMTSETDANGKTTFYEYDGFNRLKNIKDYQGNIIKNFRYNYINSCGANCVVLPMQTFNGGNTIGYPVGVFNVNQQLLGNAISQAQFITLWNGNAANQAKGVLSAGGDALHFNLTMAGNQTAPTAVTGLRYYQFDIPYNKIDAVRNSQADYVDFGDGTSMRMGKTLTDVNVVLPPNTSIYYFPNLTTPPSPTKNPYFVHNYSDNTLKTVTLYHSDDGKNSVLDNGLTPLVSLTKVKNLRGNLPQFTNGIGGSSFQEATMLSVANITNWNTINTIGLFVMNTGDGHTLCTNMNYAQDFLQNNLNLNTISTTNFGTYGACYHDLTFKLSRFKANWNTWFTKLSVININDEHWDRENLSALTSLTAFVLYASSQNHSNDPTNNPVVPIPTSAIDNIINQISAGAGQFISNGSISINSGGTTRSAASNASFTQLKSKGWTINIDGVIL